MQNGTRREPSTSPPSRSSEGAQDLIVARLSGSSGKMESVVRIHVITSVDYPDYPLSPNESGPTLAFFAFTLDLEPFFSFEEALVRSGRMTVSPSATASVSSALRLPIALEEANDIEA